MNALPNQFPLLSPPPGRSALSLEALAMCVRELDPGSRALLDLSLRRKLPFEAMAGVLHTDPFDLARRRARAVARIAAELDLEGAGVVAAVKGALARLPDDAWGVPPVAPQPPPQRDAVQAEAMAESARALMLKLAEHRARVREAATNPFAGDAAPEITASRGADVQVEPEPAPADQPTVETEAIVLPPEPEAWKPVAATPMAAAFSHHPAFAVERDDAVADLPPLAVALAQAAASERAASEAAAEQPTVEAEAIRIPTPPADRAAPPLTAPPAGERERRRRLVRTGGLVGLLLAIVRLLVGRR